MAQFDVDLFVIGAGSGGVRAARIAAEHGAKVKIAEVSRVGGTCVIRGCVPKKLLVYASRMKHEFASAQGFGWTVSATHDWATLHNGINAELDRLEGIYRRNLNKAGVEIIDSHARIAGPNAVYLEATGETISAKRILISTGARPRMPDDFPGAEHCINSDAVFTLETMPKRILIVGGGYIGLEMAGIFHNLGAQTMLVHRGDKLLRGFDEDLRDGVEEAYRAAGIELLVQNAISKIEKNAQGYTVHLSSGGVREADCVLFSAGRLPNTKGLGLEEHGITLAENGGIDIDDLFQTSVPSIYAVGDVTNRVQLTPVAIREGHAFADREFGSGKMRAATPTVPSAVFSTPELASVGLTEKEAREKYPQLNVFKTRFRPMKEAFSNQDAPFFGKLLVDGATDKVVGAHLLGESAGEMIQLVAVALTAGATKADFDNTLAVHPTIAEELVTMRTPVA